MYPLFLFYFRFLTPLPFLCPRIIHADDLLDSKTCAFHSQLAVLTSDMPCLSLSRRRAFHSNINIWTETAHACCVPHSHIQAEPAHITHHSSCTPHHASSMASVSILNTSCWPFAVPCNTRVDARWDKASLFSSLLCCACSGVPGLASGREPGQASHK